MPPVALVPVWRLTFPYVVLGFQHVSHMYLDVTPSGDASGYNADVRAGFAAPGVSTIAPAWWTNLAPVISAADASFGNAHLDRLIAGAWVVAWTETNAIAPTGGAATAKAQEFIISMYSTNHERMKVVIEETIFSGATRYIAWPTTNAPIDEILSSLFNYDGAAVAVDPWAWARARNDTYTGSPISLVSSYSKHWRRKRGLG